MIQKIIRQKFSKHTIISVAHKLESILDYNKVAVMDNGVLKEFDSPHVLLGNPKSMFAQLYNSTTVSA